MTSNLTDAQIEQLRRDAKRLVRSEGISLSVAQDRLAQAAGARNWSLLVKKRPASAPRKAPSAYRHSDVSTMPRYYLHGDQVVDDPTRFYCAECDYFAEAAHFDEPHRVPQGERALDAMERGRSAPGGIIGGRYRPADAPNLLGAAMAAELQARAAREASRSPFHCWLESQKKRDDPTGDVATDILRDDRFPVAARTYLQIRRYFNNERYVGPHVLEALRGAWREFEASSRSSRQ